MEFRKNQHNIDLGGTPQSCYNECEGVEKLAEYLGFSGLDLPTTTRWTGES